jgi:glutathione S-transferase
VGFGASLGAVGGSYLTSKLIPLLGVPELLLVAAALLAAGAALTRWADHGRQRNEPPAAHAQHRAPAATASIRAPDRRGTQGHRLGGGMHPGTFQLVFGDRYLLLTSYLHPVLNWVNTTGEPSWPHCRRRPKRRQARPAGSQQEFTGAFYFPASW